MIDKPFWNGAKTFPFLVTTWTLQPTLQGQLFAQRSTLNENVQKKI